MATEEPTTNPAEEVVEDVKDAAADAEAKGKEDVKDAKVTVKGLFDKMFCCFAEKKDSGKNEEPAGEKQEQAADDSKKGED